MGRFKVSKITNLDNVILGEEFPESDFATISTNGNFIQLKYEDAEDTLQDYPVKPGIWSIDSDSVGLKLSVSSFVQDDLLQDLISTKDVTDKIECFFNRLHIYKERNIEVPKRAMFLYGPAGTGKSSSLANVANKYNNDNKTAIIIWPTDKYEAYRVKDFIKSFNCANIERMILIVEDIGGMEMDQIRMKSDSSLLSLLDNNEKTFSIPTYIIATTNFPEIFLGNLTNRPGRFDDKIEIGYPSGDQRKKLLEFYTKNTASELALNLISSNKTAEFSIAHIRDAELRSALYDKTIEEVIEEMIKEIDYYKKAFSKKKNIGFVDHDDD